jgi:hypothetical protein
MGYYKHLSRAVNINLCYEIVRSVSLVKIVKSVVLAFILATVLALPAMASQIDVYQNNQLVKSVVFKIGVPYYVVNGQTPGVKMDVAPFIGNDRTFVPVRLLGNALGLDDSRITWEDSTQTATLKGNATLQMTIGRASVTSNGVEKEIDVAPLLQGDRTFLPARYVAEGLGYQVGWDDATQTVVCWLAGQSQPNVSAAVDFLNKQVKTSPVLVGDKVNGYTIPANTNLHIDDYAIQAGDGKWMVFSINLKAGNIDQQYADAKSIISQTVNPATTAEVIAYAKRVQYALENGSRENPILCPITTFNSPNGVAVRVAGGGNSVQFDIWSTK